MGVTSDGASLDTPEGFHYERSAHEDARIHTLRMAQASLRRRQIEQWAHDPKITDLDFMFWLHKATYEDARELARFALKIEKGEV